MKANLHSLFKKYKSFFTIFKLLYLYSHINCAQNT